MEGAIEEVEATSMSVMTPRIKWQQPSIVTSRGLAATRMTRTLAVLCLVLLLIDGTQAKTGGNKCKRYYRAHCEMRTFPASSVRGYVVFKQNLERFGGEEDKDTGEMCYPYAKLQVQFKIKGLPADGQWREYGIHIHEVGDLTSGCSSVGGHFNPSSETHGPRQGLSGRHGGDMGNVYKRPDGCVYASFRIRGVTILTPANSVQGRAVVLHEGTDDLGLGGDAGSYTSGNAGARLACCEII